MFGSSYKIAQVWGIPIRVHISLVLLILYLAFQGWRAGRETGNPLVYVGWVLLALALVFLSVALHELGHSFVAIRKGCKVREITLMFIGGAAQMERIPRRPRDELLMALAGPAVSLVLGALGYLTGTYFERAGQGNLGFLLRDLVGTLNFFLAGFNLLPAFPMDGGRVLRALRTPRVGRLRATFDAARIGKIFAFLFGIYGFLTGRWLLVFIAFFVYSSADREYRAVRQEEAARRGDTHPWAGLGFGSREPPPEDVVDVGPSPYREDSDQASEIRPDRRDPRNMFGQ
jgi:Zn-dependent protease